MMFVISMEFYVIHHFVLHDDVRIDHFQIMHMEVQERMTIYKKCYTRDRKQAKQNKKTDMIEIVRGLVKMLLLSFKIFIKLFTSLAMRTGSRYHGWRKKCDIILINHMEMLKDRFLFNETLSNFLNYSRFDLVSADNCFSVQYSVIIVWVSVLIMNVDGLFVTCPKWINSFFVNNVHLKNYIHFSQFRVFSLFGIRRVYRYHLEHSNPEG